MIYLLMIVLTCIVEYPFLKIAMKEDFKHHGEMTLKIFLLFMFMFVIVPLVIVFVVYGLYLRYR